MNRTHPFTSPSWLLFFLLVLVQLAQSAAAQFAQIRIPTNGSVLTGPTLMASRQITTSIAPNQVSSVRFEYSSNGISWNLIDTVNLPATGQDVQSFLDWDTLWDPATVAPGSYHLRSRFFLKNGLILRTPAVTITVHRPPNAVANGAISAGLTAVLDGTASSSSDGSIVSWEWNFGDGAVGVGPTVSHSYARNATFIASLTVTDNFGTKTSAYLEVSTVAVPTVVQEKKCIAKQISLRGEDAAPLNPGGQKGLAIGDDGKGCGWKQSAGHDGKTLGRLAGRPNPSNQADGLLWAGYALEIVVDVQGDPSACTEIQINRANYSTASGVVKEEDCKAKPQATYVGGVCQFDSLWKGLTNDFDKDGVLDLDVSTKAKCEDPPPNGQNGKWTNDQCLAPFSAERGSTYKPDESDQDTGAYRKPGLEPDNYLWKSHPPGSQKIVWWDAPRVNSETHKTAYYTFVAIVRGTDSKYCYADFNVQVRVADEIPIDKRETLTEVKRECGVGKTQVPGLK